MDSNHLASTKGVIELSLRRFHVTDGGFPGIGGPRIPSLHRRGSHREPEQKTGKSFLTILPLSGR